MKSLLHRSSHKYRNPQLARILVESRLTGGEAIRGIRVEYSR
jgi:hypothetical protein